MRSKAHRMVVVNDIITYYCVEAFKAQYESVISAFLSQ